MPAARPLPRTLDTMRAVALDRHGGIGQLRLRHLPIPVPGPDQLLVRVHAAGVGHWDIRDREGDFARMQGRTTAFPHVQGSEGAGVVVVPADGDAFVEGDRVYGLVAHRNPMHGFHAEFALLDAGFALPMPARFSFDQAAVVPVDGGIALRGLRDVLRMQAGESLVVFGASGGIGHIALQFAKRMDLRVLAIASGADGVRLATRLGADAIADGRRDDIADAVARFAAEGAHAALLTAGGDVADRLVQAMPPGSRVAWPHGVPAPRHPRADIAASAFGAGYGPALLRELHGVVADGSFMPHVSHRFPLERVADAQRAVCAHHLGRIAVSTL